MNFAHCISVENCVLPNEHIRNCELVLLVIIRICELIIIFIAYFQSAFLCIISISISISIFILILILIFNSLFHNIYIFIIAIPTITTVPTSVISIKVSIDKMWKSGFQIINIIVLFKSCFLVNLINFYFYFIIIIYTYFVDVHVLFE